MTGPPLAAHEFSIAVAQRVGKERAATISLSLVTLAVLLLGSLPSGSHPNAPSSTPSPISDAAKIAARPSVVSSGPTPAWSEIPTQVSPPARYNAEMTYDERDGYTVLYGGEGVNGSSQGGVWYNDTWTYSGGIWTNLSIAGPPFRSGPSMAYDPADGYVVLFGGYSFCPECNATWILSAGRWSSLNVTGPPARAHASLAWDPVLGELILFGGIGCSPGFPELQTITDCGDTWSFVHGHWSNLSISGPSARDSASIAYVPAAGGLVLFGGIVSDAYAAFADTWLFDGQWTSLSVNGPSGRIWAPMAFEPTEGGAVLFGGVSFVNPPGSGAPSQGDTWVFDGAAWKELGVSGPSARFWGTMVYDETDGYDLMFGGMWCPGGDCFSNPPVTRFGLDETWSFSLGRVMPAVTVSVEPTALCVVDDFSCAAQARQAEVNVSIHAAYVTAPSGGATLADPVLRILPWGQVQLDPSSPPVASCQTTRGALETCDSAPAYLAVGANTGFEVGWSSNPDLNSLYVGDVWTAKFGITVAGPPYGSVPVYACATGACIARGSGAIDGSFSDVIYQPISLGSKQDDSLPYANITVDPPRLPPGGSSPPTSTTPPPPPATPVGLPGPITVPSPVPISNPILVALATAVPTVSLTAVAAGVISAGFARVVLQHRAIAQGQPVGNVVRPTRSAFEAERASDPKVGRFE